MTSTYPFLFKLTEFVVYKISIHTKFNFPDLLPTSTSVFIQSIMVKILRYPKTLQHVIMSPNICARTQKTTEKARVKPKHNF